jgi:hypothetical protein
MSSWTESKLACLWGKEKTRRLLAAGTLRPYHIGEDGRRYFTHEAVMTHYAYKSANAPSQACCSCCGHCAELPSSEAYFAKAFGQGRVGRYAGDEDSPDGFEDDPDDQDVLDDNDDQDDDEDLDPSWISDYVDGPGLDDDEDDALDEPDGGSLADYHDERLAELDAVEKLSAAVDALAFENALTMLQAGRLTFRAALARTFG